MENDKKYRDAFESGLKNYLDKKSPENLYEPIQYILNLGGKRIRPLLVLMSADLFGKKYKEAVSAALAIEIFHNFTLVHDDIMDSAELRRGSATVHNKWNINTGIISGDVMLIKAYQALEEYENPLFSKLTKLLNKTALEVCEGQQYDIDFEEKEDVNQNNYLEMIRLKTAVLIGCALKMGALIADASQDDLEAIYEFGELLGIAFQIQDDYLDVYGDSISFGKKIGGDIIENKKTILFHCAMSNGSINEKKELLKWYDKKTGNEIGNKKIDIVKSIFDKTNAGEACIKLVNDYTIKAFNKLSYLGISQEAKTLFKNFGNNLMKREF
ncbi:polyprenyl synthetase family protein [Flavobacteriaceae bacterium]|nr:polyprenyl synthetase family protein [Flavobacteriaceae bacterium]